MNERRKYPRFELMVKADYSILDSKEVYAITRTKNISAEGLCFESDQELRPGTHVRLKLNLNDKDDPVFVIGQVKWSSQVKDSSGQKIYVNGIKLIDLPHSDEGRFLKYYCDKMVEKLSDYLKI